MINEQLNYVEGYAIQDMWRDIMWLTIKNGYDYMVEKGSYEGQIRKQLDRAFIRITNPGVRPLAPIMPPGITGSTDEETIIKYFHRYIVGTEREPGEDYTYGEFIMKQLQRAMDILVESNGHSNQSRICIGNEDSCYQKDPPCLNNITFKLVEGKLNMGIMFRSWDLYGAMPQNLGGLQMLKEMIVEYLNIYFPVEDGELYAFSDGLHIYDMYFETVDKLNLDKIKVGAAALEAKKKYLEVHGA